MRRDRNHEDIQRLRLTLCDRVEESSLGDREIEEKMTISRGYLTRLLSGRIDLKLWQTIGLIDLLGENPEAFFQEIFPIRQQVRTMPEASRLRLSAGVVEVYGLGIGTIRELRERLERIEQLLADLATGKLGEVNAEPARKDSEA